MHPYDNAPVRQGLWQMLDRCYCFWAPTRKPQQRSNDRSKQIGHVRPTCSRTLTDTRNVGSLARNAKQLIRANVRISFTGKLDPESIAKTQSFEEEIECNLLIVRIRPAELPLPQ